MKYKLPDQHGLVSRILNDNDLIPRTPDGDPSVTDIQYDALNAGIALGKSMLVVAPTSTGKTNIALWGLLSWLSAPHIETRSAVYLVSHRALARQKFQEFQSYLCDSHFDGDRSAVVLATGDGIEDGTGTVILNPLQAPLLVATYEKYLALLSGSSIRENMSRVLVVCDEVQIIGDESRGRNIEILLTLLKNSQCGQIVALSAVIDKKDAQMLSDWLSLTLVHNSIREKHLTYECRMPGQVLTFNTDKPDEGVRTEVKTLPVSTDEIVTELYSHKENLPIVVFSMTLKAVDDCVKDFIRRIGVGDYEGLPLLTELHEDTESARLLGQLLQHRIAFHTADLLEEERRLVEQKLHNGEIDIIFSTTTLAAGVNFSFTTAVFDDWERYDFKSKTRKSIPNNEFQNMAGRAGRMGFEAERGRVIFCADNTFAQKRVAAAYLTPDAISPLHSQLGPSAFEQVSLWLISNGICESEEDIKEFLLSTFSASREQNTNMADLAHWKMRPREIVDQLREWGFVL